MNTRTLQGARLALVAGLVLGSAPAIAEKIDCAYSKKTKQNVSNQVIEPGDRPDRRLSQYVRVDVLSSKFTEWDGAEQTVYGHSDTVGGAGISTGYSMTTLKTGEKIWSRWESVQYLIPKGGDAWEVPFQGVFRFIAGTGKYKAIRGGGHFRGTATPTGITQENVCEAEY
jgi:hypothetical protein